jgi:hypothetical protein
MQQRPPSFGLNSVGLSPTMKNARLRWRDELKQGQIEVRIRPARPNTLHKITAKMAKTLGLDQNDENQSKKNNQKELKNNVLRSK